MKEVENKEDEYVRLLSEVINLARCATQEELQTVSTLLTLFVRARQHEDREKL